jgi:hypothetical protein
MKSLSYYQLIGYQEMCNLLSQMAAHEVNDNVFQELLLFAQKQISAYKVNIEWFELTGGYRRLSGEIHEYSMTFTLDEKYSNLKAFW